MVTFALLASYCIGLAVGWYTHHRWGTYKVSRYYLRIRKEQEERNMRGDWDE